MCWRRLGRGLVGGGGSCRRLMGAVRRVGIFVKSVIAVFACPVAVLVRPAFWLSSGGESESHELGVKLG